MHFRIPIPVALVAIFLLLGAGANSAHAKPLTLVEEGQPRATIVVSAMAGDKTKFAAQELQQYLAKISGVTLVLKTDAEKPQGALILVGKSALTEAMRAPIPAGLTGARREEGFLIECKGDRLVLAGNDAGPYHGTEYAVYEFLNRLGVRWYMPGAYGEIVPKHTTVTFPEIRVLQKPDFLMRNWWLHATPEMAEQERRWKLRNKMNPDAIFAIPGDSSARNLIPEATYFKTHPEYFAQNADGTRNPYMPNLTNPKAVEVAAETIKEYLRKHPDENSYGFAPDDGLPRDFDPETVKHNLGLPSLSGRPGVPAEASISEEWMAFVNNVTKEVRKEFPDAYIATNGYANRDVAPQGVTLDDHIVVMFAAIWSCTLHAYNSPTCWQKERQGQILKRWAALSKNVWIYGYNYQMLVSCLTPLPEIRKLRHDMPLLKQWGVIGFDDETRNVWAECGIPSRYLRARLEWDVHTDVDTVVNEFYDNWYGNAARPMHAFYDAIEDSIEKTPIHGHEDRVLPEIYTPALLETLKTDMDEAEHLADTDVTRQHVHADRLIYTHLQHYVEMSRADFAGEFAQAATHAVGMLAVRKELHQIDPFYIWDDENGYHTGIWYWGAEARQKFYQEQADRLSGKTGTLVAMLPVQADFRTDPRDEGVYAEWYAPKLPPIGWRSLLTTRPFYVQDNQDAQGYPYQGSLWYRLKVKVPDSARGKRVMLVVPTVETEAWCWVNGKFVGYRPYLEAYIRPAAMECDVTDALRPGAENEVTLRVHTSLNATQEASGLLSRLYLYAPGTSNR